jgi:protoheme IX farnesyltransferase
MMKEYIKLMKPGIIMGNAITACGGFLLASKGQFNISLFLAMLIGLSLIIGSGCTLNNYKDKAIDQKMLRTKNRALVKGTISDAHALIYAWTIFAVGSGILWIFTNILTLCIACLGFYVYVFVYTPMKVRSIHGTLIGSIAGAVPPVVGYCAYSAEMDLSAFLLFVIVALWQMPHFYAIALYRIEEYKEASIPVLPLVRGIEKTKVQMFIYTLGFSLAALLPYFFGFTGRYYLIVTVGVSALWLYVSLKGLFTQNTYAWAKQMFRLSLVVIMSLSLMISID